MLSPSTLFCHNFVAALALQKTGEGVCRLSSQPPTPSHSFQFSTTVWQPPPKPHPPPPSSSVISIHPHRTIATNPRRPRPRFETTLILSVFLSSVSLPCETHENRCRSVIPAAPHTCVWVTNRKTSFLLLEIYQIRNLINDVNHQRAAQAAGLSMSAHCWWSICQSSSVCVHRENTLSHRENTPIQRIVAVFHLSMSFWFKPVIYSCFCLFPPVEQGQGTIRVYLIIARSLWVSQTLS